MSEVKVNKISPRSGTAITLGDSGDTFTIPSGATLAIAGSVTGFTSAGIDDNATSVAITINSSEQVGIGTASPSQPLHVYSTGNDIARIETNQTEGRLSLKDATGEAILKFRNDYRFTNSTGELARLNSSGNFGIGTSSPLKKLVASNSGAEGIELSPGDSSNVNMVLNYNRSTSAYIASQQRASYHRFDIDTTEGMRLTSTGLGIGTTSPSRDLVIKQSSGDASFRMETASRNNDVLTLRNSTGRLDFADLKMVVLADGKVGIGTTTPAGAVGTDTVLEITGSVSPGLVINDTGQAQKYQLYADSTKFKMNYGSTNFLTYDASNSNLGIGTTSPSEKLEVNGTIKATAFIGAGRVLQVIQTVKTTDFSASVATDSVADITGLSAAITPSSSSSKILVSYDIHLHSTGGSTKVQLMRDSTKICINTSTSGFEAQTSMSPNDIVYGLTVTSMSFLDSPSTTSAVTYKPQVSHASANTQTIYCNAPESPSSRHGRFTSQITLMEIAG